MTRTVLGGAVLVLALLAVPAAPGAHDYRAGSITIGHPWARATAPGARAGAVFMALSNDGPVEDRLIAATTEAADKAELHTHIMDGGIMRMREVEGGIAVPAGQAVMLAPGGLHVMLLGLRAPLEQGGSIPVTLTFERSGSTTVQVAVEEIAATGAATMGHGAGAQHGQPAGDPAAPAR